MPAPPLIITKQFNHQHKVELPDNPGKRTKKKKKKSNMTLPHDCLINRAQIQGILGKMVSNGFLPKD